MPAPELEWKLYDVSEFGVSPPELALAGTAAPIRVCIPDLSEYPLPRGKAKILLETAAEVEHALLVQYLYAAFSLKETSVVTDPARQNAVEQWSEVVRGIAIEEMAHLITVQNLLLAIGLPPNLEREDFPPPKDLYPFKLHLQPLTQRSLAKYVTAEAPEDAIGIEDIIEQAKEKEGADINRVGVIYGMLGVVFSTAPQIADGSNSDSWDTLLRRFAAAAYQQDADRSAWHLGDDAIDPQTLAFQARKQDWRAHDSVIVHQIEDRAAALNAIRQIGEQGEGRVSADQESHFGRFLGIYRGSADLSPFPALGQWIPTRVVPTDPCTETIAEPRTQRWARLADMRYALLLGFIEHYLLTPDTADRANLARRWAFGEMSNLAQLSNHLVELPQGDGVSAVPFTLPKPLHLPATEVERWQLHRARTNAAIAHVQQMQAADPDDMNDNFLRNMLTADTARLLSMHGETP